MNVYDFDKTILNKDSSQLFLLHCIHRYPGAFLRAPGAKLLALYGYAAKKESVEQLKETLFSVIRYIPDLDAELKRFWDANENRVEPYYKKIKKADDLVISASPEFLVKPMTDRLGVALIGTRMSRATGAIQGSNCKGAEKVRRFREAYPDSIVEKFYSDSLSDTPMAELAEEAFLIVRHNPVPWPWPEKKTE